MLQPEPTGETLPRAGSRRHHAVLTHPGLYEIVTRHSIRLSTRCLLGKADDLLTLRQQKAVRDERFLRPYCSWLVVWHRLRGHLWQNGDVSARVQG